VFLCSGKSGSINAQSSSLIVKRAPVLSTRLAWGRERGLTSPALFCLAVFIPANPTTKSVIRIGIKNKRLNALSAKLQADAATQHQEIKEKVRLFGAFQYKAHSWDRQRRVIVKAEHNAHGANPRYVVTNREGEPQGLYEQDYCARGEMENRIKEQQLDLFSDRTSCHEWWREPVPGIALLLCLRAK
jgi:hypothetical protein